MNRKKHQNNNSSCRELLISSFKETLNGFFKKFLFGGLGSFLAAFYIGKNLLNYEIKDSIFLGLLLFLGIFMCEFLIRLLYKLWLKFKFIQNESLYGEAIIILKDGFARIHSLRKLNPMPDDNFKSTMIYLCDQVKKIFDSLTKAECSVSIKVGVNEGDMSSDTEVTTLCRDSSVRGRDTLEYLKIKHVVFMNTCFNSILTKLKDPNKFQYYINNDINNTENYENTSKTCYKNEILPYCSEFVVPILPIIRENRDFNLVGFLCVDCDIKGGFDEKYDPHILQGVADGIYDIIVTRSFTKPKLTE